MGSYPLALEGFRTPVAFLLYFCFKHRTNVKRVFHYDKQKEKINFTKMKITQGQALKKLIQRKMPLGEAARRFLI